ncbi:4Fe-4S ferredoxin [Desulfobacterales bacterium HSG16]|nr:4Fe-4S ferredoxin [Desulfobacterales bacterium HSG16]
MKVLRKIIQIDDELCDGCGQCIPGCAEGALQIIDGKVRIVEDKYCDGLGACLGECPNNALKVIEREAEEFDEDAVEEHLKKQKPEEKGTMACGCPSTQIQSFAPGAVAKDAACCSEAGSTIGQSDEESTLTNWPVQIKLIPPAAPFLADADLLVTADCVPVVFPAFQKELLKGRVVMMGCPKFDDVQEYIQRFAEIFKTANIKSVTCAIMEVPCCSSLPTIIKKGMEAAQKDIPFKQIVLSARGKVIDQG